MVLFDSSLIANAQSPRQSITSRPVTQQQEEETIIRQGTVTSSQDPLLGHEEHQMATILPFRQDGTLYAGVLTYTSTQPVEVVILNMQILNETEQQILNDTEDDGEFGTLLSSQLDNQTSIAISYIIPEYGDSPAPSASIPFAGNAVWLHTVSGEPFAATFAASAQVLKSEIRNNISNLADTTVTVTPEVDEIDAEDVATANATAAATEGAGIEEDPEDAMAMTTSEDNIASTTDANILDADDDAANNEEEVIVRIPQGSSSLTDDAYIPNPVEVNIGDTVTWINDDFTSHTATSGAPDSGSTGIFGGTEDSPEIIGPEGDTQSYTFDEAGEFPYYCTLHPSMVGTVVVTEG
ncbi:MAG TPA: plastocyanin/azurin family copper-binding protein [Nitrososphaera sp.]|nr:plastocyanin/azurin family copper-binding protein [Nitrososphaera sp.]